MMAESLSMYVIKVQIPSEDPSLQEAIADFNMLNNLYLISPRTNQNKFHTCPQFIPTLQYPRQWIIHPSPSNTNNSIPLMTVPPP